MKGTDGKTSGARLIILCGLPGSGKTTTARRLEAEHSAVRFSADEWMSALSINLHDEEARARVEALQWTFCQKLLRQRLSVIIDWGSWGRWERDILRSRARELGAQVELHYLSAPLDVLYDRIRHRGIENPPIRREALDRWAALLEIPGPEELALYDVVRLDSKEATDE